MKAYNIEVLPQSVSEEGPRGGGWCFGLPPGIVEEQWPLDANTGYPLQHGFTLLLPPEYRGFGPDIVALSFFGSAHDEDEGRVGEIAALVADADASEPSDSDLYPFWMSERLSHPRLYRIADFLGRSHAVILLTEAEFNAPFCQPPRLRPNKYRDRIRRPEWLARGAAAVYLDDQTENYGLLQMLGDTDNADLFYNRALDVTPRAEDPNAGIAPRDEWAAAETGYQAFYYWEGDEVEEENYREHAWAADHLPDHIGGSMRPAQNIPDISPYYIEFEEYLGGFNFGGGNAWLDLQTMSFDWAQ